MALSIGPTGSAAERRLSTQMHGVGLLLGAWTMALVLTLTGVAAHALVASVPSPLRIAAALLVLGWSVGSLTRKGPPYPRSRWQVPAEWREKYPPAYTLAAFGYLLGLGVLTDVVVPVFWVLLGATIVIAEPLTAAAAWSLYAAARLHTTIRTIDAVRACPVPTQGLPGDRGLRRVRAASAVTLLTLAVALTLH